MNRIIINGCTEDSDMLDQSIGRFLDFQLRKTLHEIDQPDDLKMGLGSIYNPEKVIDKYLETV